MPPWVAYVTVIGSSVGTEPVVATERVRSALPPFFTGCTAASVTTLAVSAGSALPYSSTASTAKAPGEPGGMVKA